MKISLDWLNDYIETGLEAERIAEILSDQGFPCEGIEQIGSDFVIDVEVTSNRGDCLSYIGIARELAVATGKELKIPEIKQEELEKDVTEFADVEIPSQLTNSVTLSTMHGCPPDEIERIARYLLEERGLHTIVKLNPTLLGKEKVMRILHTDLGYRKIYIPDVVFEHDLQYDQAVQLVSSLRRSAAERDLFFGIKLTNTLAMANHKGALPGDEMYMSGRALYPITINLFNKFAQEFDGHINVSYSGGADALNVTMLLAAGALPVTAASDLLKPGGYSRFLQFLENLRTEMHQRGVASLDELAQNKLANLAQAAADALQDPRYEKAYHPYGLPKVESGLELFDCVAAPCMEQCAVSQDVPEYAWLIAQGEYDRALEVILARNPLPGVNGYVCTHLCQTRCTRNNYDEPVAIRALKRFAAESPIPNPQSQGCGHWQWPFGAGSGLIPGFEWCPGDDFRGQEESGRYVGHCSCFSNSPGCCSGGH